MKIALEQKRGITVSKRIVLRTNVKMGRLHKKRIPLGTTKVTTEAKKRENLIKRNFKAEKPLRKLLSDITEVQCFDGKLYVFVVLVCYNGEILSDAMYNNMQKDLCIQTVKELYLQYGKKKLCGAIFYSDRGRQYTNEAFRNALFNAGLIQSLTGHCFVNARIESFFATLKKEKIYRICAYKLTREHVKSLMRPSQNLCKPSMWCRIETTQWRKFYVKKIEARKNKQEEKKSKSCCS